MRHLGICLGHGTERAAAAWVRSLGLPDTTQACVHRAGPRVAVSFALAAGTAVELPAVSARFAEAAARAGAAHAGRRSGRAVHFRGRDVGPGAITVAELLGRTEIGRVLVAGVEAAPDDIVDAGRGLNPHWIDGVLTVRADRLAGLLVPRPGFEDVADAAHGVDQRRMVLFDLSA